MPTLFSLRNRTALVTGASSGIGAAMARELAGLGVHLILTARRRAKLEALAIELRQNHPVSVAIFDHDLSESGAARTLFDKIQSANLHVDIVVNNAGVGKYGSFVKETVESDEQMLRLNIEAPTVLTHLLLPSMLTDNFGIIMNVSSVAAWYPIGGFSVYTASKQYILHFTEALAEELRGTNIRVLIVCPGTTHTEFHDRANTSGMAPAFTIDSASDVARCALNALQSKKRRAIPGLLNRLLTLFPSFFPRAWVSWTSTTIYALAQAKSRRRSNL